MNKNLVIGIIIGAVIAGGIVYFVGKKGNPTEEGGENMTVSQRTMAPSGAPQQKQGQNGRRPSLAGKKLSSTKFASNAVLVFPGTLTSEAKAALVGFNLTTKAAADGSTQVSLIPTESGYVFQQYTVKSGQSLYFIEMNRGDDVNGTTDINKRDDFAVVVDQNGVIQ